MKVVQSEVFTERSDHAGALGGGTIGNRGQALEDGSGRTTHGGLHAELGSKHHARCTQQLLICLEGRARSAALDQLLGQLGASEFAGGRRLHLEAVAQGIAKSTRRHAN